MNLASLRWKEIFGIWTHSVFWIFGISMVTLTLNFKEECTHGVRLSSVLKIEISDSLKTAVWAVSFSSIFVSVIPYANNNSPTCLNCTKLENLTWNYDRTIVANALFIKLFCFYINIGILPYIQLLFLSALWF